MKIVLIYEDAQQLASVQQSVQAEGYELTDILQRTADTTLQSLIDKIQTDVLIVDCTGPQSTQDIVTLESFLNTHPQVGVLMLSQSRDANTLVAAMQAGVRELLTSPPTAADLAAALRRFAVRMKAVSGKMPYTPRPLLSCLAKAAVAALYWRSTLQISWPKISKKDGITRLRPAVW